MTNHAHRQVQFQMLDFCNLGSDLHAIKSASSRKDHPNADTYVLNEQHVEPCNAENLDDFCSRMTLSCCVDKEDDEWRCTCAWFSSARAANTW